MLDSIAHGTGVALQIVGAVVALLGVDRSKRDLFPGSDGLPVARWIRRRWRRWRGGPATVVGSAAGEISLIGVRARGRTGTPPDATTDERIMYLERQVSAILDAVDNLSDTLDEERREIRRELTTAEERMAGRLWEVERRSAEMVGGRGGSGFDLTAYGVVLAIAGTVLTAL